MPKNFISYRQDDSSGHAGRFYDRLVDHFGQGQVFMEVDTIKPGLDFVDVVKEAIGSCDALIGVIGREWLGASDGSGRRRLENPEDLVRLEIATALTRVTNSPIPFRGVGQKYSFTERVPPLRYAAPPFPRRVLSSLRWGETPQ